MLAMGQRREQKVNIELSIYFIITYAFHILMILICISVRGKLTQFNTELRFKVQNTLGRAYCNLTNKMKEFGVERNSIFLVNWQNIG